MFVEGSGAAYADCQEKFSDHPVVFWDVVCASRADYEQEWEVLSPPGTGPTLIFSLKTQHVIPVQSCPI